MLQNETKLTSNLMNEVEIAKILAHKYAKAAFTDDSQEKQGQKELTRDQFKNIYKVWNAFVKFIRNQVLQKSRMVDTQLIGCFYQKDGVVEFLISQDFFEAGKFKNKQQPQFSKQEEIIKQFKDSGKLVSVNESSISYVCHVPTSYVHKTLNDFFAALIEVSRRTQSEAVLDFKIGNLHLYKNGEIMFESKNENGVTNTQRNELRDDLSIIDTASAILSFGGGKAISIKSDYMENLSVRTPASQMSKTSYRSAGSCRAVSTNNKQRQDWLKYRMRGPQSLNPEQKIEKKSNSELVTLDNASTERKSSLPYPFLAAFIERRTGQRFTKRVKFDQSEDQRRILGHIVDQINSKTDLQKQQQHEKLDNEQEFINDLRDKLRIDQQRLQNDKIKKQVDFIQANEALRQEKKQKSQYEQEQKISYNPTYFPFNHGDSIEQQRLALRGIQKQDLIESLEKRKALSSEKHKRSYHSSQTPKNMLANIKLSDTLNPISNYQNSFLPSQSGVCFARSLNSYPYKAKVTQNMTMTQNGARERFEEQLQREKEQKLKYIEIFNDSISKEQKIMEQEKIKKHKQKLETKKELSQQIHYNQAMKEFYYEQDKKQEKTHFGPEDDDDILYEIEKKNSEAVSVNKIHLMQMMEEKKQQQDYLKKLEQSLDQRRIEGMLDVFKGEEKEKQRMEHMNKQQQKSDWNEHAQVNQKIKTVDGLIL